VEGGLVAAVLGRELGADEVLVADRQVQRDFVLERRPQPRRADVARGEPEAGLVSVPA
jgi:hypothetical protein